jgi:hypothetical protein|tara:strand:+ start:1252 stop:1440 length:189 start_codon:yes stop_codon:yes gene_type:complete
MEWIKKFHESLHSMSIKNHIKAHYADSKRLEALENKIKILEPKVEALQMEHDILYAASLKRE